MDVVIKGRMEKPKAYVYANWDANGKAQVHLCDEPDLVDRSKTIQEIETDPVSIWGKAVQD